MKATAPAQSPGPEGEPRHPRAEHDPSFGKFVLGEMIDQQEKKHPDHVIFTEYSLTDLHLISEECYKYLHGDPRIVEAADLLLKRVRAEIGRRIFALWALINHRTSGPWPRQPALFQCARGLSRNRGHPGSWAAGT